MDWLLEIPEVREATADTAVRYLSSERKPAVGSPETQNRSYSNLKSQAESGDTTQSALSQEAEQSLIKLPVAAGKVKVKELKGKMSKMTVKTIREWIKSIATTSKKTDRVTGMSTALTHVTDAAGETDLEAIVNEAKRKVILHSADEELYEDM